MLELLDKQANLVMCELAHTCNMFKYNKKYGTCAERL